MSDFSFIHSLESYDIDDISENILDKLIVYTGMPEFVPSYVEKKSVAAKSLVSIFDGSRLPFDIFSCDLMFLYILSIVYVGTCSCKVC